MGSGDLIKQITFYPMKFTELVFETMTNEATYTFYIAKRLVYGSVLASHARESCIKRAEKTEIEFHVFCVAQREILYRLKSI